MHIIYKLLWTIRAVLLKAFFGQLDLPSYIGSPTFLYNPKSIFIGRRVRIFPGLRAECHQGGKLYIHNNVSIGQNLHITCMGTIHIGSGTNITGNVMITDIDHEYRDVTESTMNQPNLYSKTEIGENCFIGFGARLQAGTVLGRGCIVGTNSVLRGTFPDHCVIVGAPGKIVKRYNHDTKLWDRI